MFGLIKGLMGSVNLWFLLAVAAAGFSAGAAVTYPLATWKERAQWTAPMKEFADARSADLAASEAARAAQALEFTQAVRDVALKNQNTQLIVSTVLDNIGGLKDEIGTVRARLLTLPVGSCVFTVDADSLRGAAYKAARNASGESGAAEGGEAPAGNEGTDRPPCP